MDTSKRDPAAKGAAMRAVVALLLGACGTSATVAILAHDLEAVAGGLLFAVYLVPSIVLFVAFSLWKPGKWFKHLAFALPLALLMCLAFLHGLLALRDPQSQGPGGQLSLYIGFSILVGGVVAYVVQTGAVWRLRR